MPVRSSRYLIPILELLLEAWIVSLLAAPAKIEVGHPLSSTNQLAYYNCLLLNGYSSMLFLVLQGVE